MHQRGRDNELKAGELEEILRSLEGAPYPAYRETRGRYRVGSGTLEILHVQADPFAPPSRLRVMLPREAAGLDRGGPAAADRASAAGKDDLATEDFLARGVEEWLRSHPETGSIVRIDPAGQQILRRTALTLRPDRIEILLHADLPARGRRIEGRRAAAALSRGLPQLVLESLTAGSYDSTALERHRASVEDHRALRGIIAREGWVAFLADGSHLARRAGDDDAPLGEGNVPFVAPPELAAEVTLPRAGRLRGMALPAGIVLLCGGAFHGKSTLLRALAAAVYPHIPGDGRELVSVEPTAMGIRAEDGRAVTDIDLRPFLRNLPNGTDPARFRTENASGATSQAAAVIEALGAGCRCLLIDEDTSATNFLLRDPWVARLLRPEQEPIVPLLSRLREIHDRFGTSTILVVGGSGEAFRIADRAILMDAYHPQDASSRVAEIRMAMGPATEVPPAVWPDRDRLLSPGQGSEGSPRIRAVSARRVLIGSSEIDLSASGALVHPSQGRTLATVVARWLEDGSGSVDVAGAAERAAQRLETEGPGAFAGQPRGDLAEVRVQEIMMLVNRLRTSRRANREPRWGTGSPSRG
jgi:predicted ABC-class ATPase